MLREEAVGVVDAALGDRAVVFGSLPPEGRDLDLLVRDDERGPLEDALVALGFRRSRGAWVRFAAAASVAVDVVPAGEWRLPQDEVDGLFAAARPLPSCRFLARPAPHHALLLLARRVARGTSVDAKRRRAVARALAEDPRAWELARTAAPSWGAERGLAALERAIGGQEAPPERARRAGRRLRRASRVAVVSLSGLDGAGKSSQSQLLCETLRALGIDAVPVWLPLGQDAAVERLSAEARRLLRLGRRVGVLRAVEARTAAGASLVARPGGGPRHGGKAAALHGWTSLVALANAWSQRRTMLRNLGGGRVVVLDRGILDSIVRLRYLYGEEAGFPLERAILRLVAPAPRRAILLEVAPGTALARKQDRWSLDDLGRQARLYVEEAQRLGVVCLDAERPPGEVAADVAALVWEALP